MPAIRAIKGWVTEGRARMAARVGSRIMGAMGFWMEMASKKQIEDKQAGMRESRSESEFVKSIFFP